jgi:signal transduction histidine kinase
VSATLGAVTAAALAAPLRDQLQSLVDRRFNRRRYDAIEIIKEALVTQRAGSDPEALFRVALNDPSVTVGYPGEGGTWLRANGDMDVARPASVVVSYLDFVVARVGFDPAVSEPDTIEAAATLAASELDNVRLRAELARQLSAVSESRGRIASAQRRERRRIERDLHDGAQQRLLALAMDLQAAHLSGNAERLDSAVAAGIVQARHAVEELRELANGLHPSALTDGGLPAALDDMASRSPVPITVRADSTRVEPALEFTAWLVACEAISNAQKHANAESITVDYVVGTREIRLTVADDGCGAADTTGTGLRGLRDRVEAGHGVLVVTSPTAGGTTVEMRLPCAR